MVVGGSLFPRSGVLLNSLLDWYHNSAVIIFACIFSWLAGIFGGGLGWIFIIMAFCATYYRTSIRRVRRNFRDDITREMGVKKLETDSESLEWINSFMAKFWPIYQPVLAATIIASVDQVLSGATPAFLDSLKLKTFTLGSKPPRLEHVKTYPREEDDVVIMDWKFSFTPNDTADMTQKQISSKLNPKVVLEIRVGKAMISKGLDVIVENMAFSGTMRVKIKLQIPFPHVEKAEICFLERPTIDYVCKPLGGDTFGFDINFIPGLEGFILEQIHGNLAPMMYAPNVFPIEIAKMLAGSPVDQAIGVVAITLHGAQGLKNPDNFSGTTDPYAIITLNRRAPLAQTKMIKDTSNPRWNETHYVIVTSFNDSLDLEVYDYNEFRKDKELGVASFPLESLEDIHDFENESLEVISNGKARGLVSCDLHFFPVLEAQKLPDGKEAPPPESNTGILRYTVEQAKDLDGTKSLVGLLNPFASLVLNNKEVHVTKKLKRTNNPIWENGSKEILITDRRNAKLGVVVKDDRDIAGDQVIGSYQIKLDDMLDLMGKGQDWYNLAGAKTGRVKLQAQWKPVALSTAIAGSGGYQTPIGVMRFHFKKATDLRNFETMGKSDPYARVLLSGIEKARTVTFQNNLNPAWDEVLYVPVHSPREKLSLEVMDAEKMGKDRTLGSIDVFAGDYVSQSEDGEYLTNDSKVLHEDGLRLHGKGIAKGVLSYTVSFYPALNVADPEDEEKEAAEDQVDAKSDGKKSLDVPRSPEAGKFSSNLSKANGDQEQPKTPVTPKTPITPRSQGRPSKDERRKVYLTPQELLKHESGLVIFRLMEAELPRSSTQVEVWVDDMAFPSYVSSTAKTRTFKFDEIGDCFIRELDFSKLTIKVRERGENSDGGKDRTLARLTGNTLDTLKQCLVSLHFPFPFSQVQVADWAPQNNPTTLKLKDEDGKLSSIKISLKYVPVKMQLDPSESINNMGNLRVDVLDATDLPSADSNGKSDPYCKFELNGQDVFKSKVIKKTLSPQWNEFFEIPIPSRTAAKFNVKVMDYDFADKPDYLGGASINLEQLDPFKAQEIKLILDGKSGTLRLRLLFRPDYVQRTRQGTSALSGTFAAPARIMTGVAGAPIKGGAAVGGAVAHGIGKGTSVFKRGFGSKKSVDINGSTPQGSSADLSRATSANPSIVLPGRDSVIPSTENGAGGSDVTPPDTADGDGASRARTRSIGGASMASKAAGGAPGSSASTGTATFTIVSATGFPPSSDVYVQVNQVQPKKGTIGKTKHHKSPNGTFKFDETFKASCAADAQFQIQAKEHNTFSSDDDLGEAAYFVDDSNSGAEKEVKVGSGSVVVRSAFTPAESSNGGMTTESPRSTSGGMRKSFLSKRDSRGPSRETTPVP
jgi:Ca2+-dependent lipid-binding protein